MKTLTVMMLSVVLICQPVQQESKEVKQPEQKTIVTHYETGVTIISG